MSAVLGYNDVYVYESDVIKHLGVENYAKLKKTFIRTVFLNHNVTKSAKLVSIINIKSSKVLVIKRFLAFSYLEKGYLKSITNTLELPIDKPLTNKLLTCDPYPEQAVLVDYVIDKIYNKTMIELGKAGVILEVPAGSGKTFIAGMIAHRLGYKCLYVVANIYLMNQAFKDLTSILPNTKIGKYYGMEKTDGDIVIIVINSILNLENPREFFNRFGLSIWDEIQDYCTSTRCEAFKKVNSICMLGITAEANNREDKMDFLSHYSCGSVLRAQDVPNYTMPENENYTSFCNIIRYNGPDNYTRNIICDATNMMQVSAMNRQIIQDPYRMQLILDFAIKFYKEGRNFFIWTDMRALVYIIQQMLTEYGIECTIYDIDSISLMGGSTMDTIEQAQTSRVIVATYQYAYKGISLPNFDSMIFATPRRSKIYQTLKRIYRLGGDPTKIREIVDIVDNKTNLKSQFSSRKKEYDNPVFNMTYTTNKIDYTSIILHDKMSSILSTASIKYLDSEHIIE